MVAQTSAVEASRDAAGWKHGFAEVNGVRLHYVEAGEGPLVLLLHGFPELWYGWRRQIPALAAAGFRVVAPDLRGYGRSDKPRGVAAYGVRELVRDVRGLIERLGAAQASVVGHDWGAGIAWAFAMQYPEALGKLGILNGPHPVRMLQALRTLEQLVKSWYIFFFQLPGLPEYSLRRSDYAMLFAALDPLPNGERLSSAERAEYRAAFAEPGALRAMVNYYRALGRPWTAPKPVPVHADVLILWGERDPYLGRELARPEPYWAPRARVEYLPAGHFVQHELPVEVNRRLIDFLR
jgi:pimeloyl-ACP methyl ester carboxylesterase